MKTKVRKPRVAKCRHAIKELKVDVQYGVSAECSCGAVFRPIWKEVKLSRETKKKINAMLRKLK